MFDGETLVHKWGVVGTLLRMVCNMLSGSGRSQGRAGRPVRRGGGGGRHVRHTAAEGGTNVPR